MNKFLKLFVFLLIFTLFVNPETVFGVTGDATVEVLGGGGGGGFITNSGGGGGGGGEYRNCTENLSIQSYTVTVGVGGTIDTTGETDSTFSGTGITLTADGGNGTADATAGTAGTGGVSTNCDIAVSNFDGGTPAAGNTTDDAGGGAGGGAGEGGKGGNGAAASTTVGGGGGGGGGESGAGGNAAGVTAGTAGTGGGGAGGAGGNAAVGGAGVAGTPATYNIVGGGGGGGGDNTFRGGTCGAPGAGSGGGEVTGAGNGCRGEIRIIYVDADVDATGGTQTTSGIFRIHTFTTSGTFTVTRVIVPTVQTNFVNNVSGTSAILYGEKTGGADATQHGFAYSTVSTFLTGVSTTTNGTLSFDVGFSSNISGISQDTTYFYRAYGTNGSGTNYGIIRSFYSGNSTVTRKMLLFQGAKLKILNNKIIIHQQ